MIDDILSGAGGLGVVLDVLLNSAEFLTIFADTLLTPMILFAFTILPNVDVPADMAWVHDAFILAAILFGTVVLADAVTDAIQRWRAQNDT